MILWKKSSVRLQSQFVGGLCCLKNAIHNAFLTCLWCGVSSKGIALCQDCYQALPWLKEACPHCALPLQSPNNTLCPACQLKPLPFMQVRALFRYEPPISHFVSALKFKEKLYYAKLFGQLMSQAFTSIVLPEVLIPVPLHPKRLRARGFNQALEIARPISKQLGIPLLRNACQRQHDTPPQLKLKKSQRKKNMARAFTIPKPIPYQHVAIIDDVMTTGSTLLALQDVLLKAGVQKVEVWCVCRALSDRNHGS